MSAEKRLKDRQCAAAPKRERAYRLNDGGGLFLQIRPDAGKYFQFRYRHGGKEKLFQIGPYPEVSLEQARQRLIELRAWVREGKDPVIERRLGRAKAVSVAASTFQSVATHWLAYHRPTWSPAHHERNEGLLRRILYPTIGNLPIDQVPATALLKGLREEERRGHLESVRRARAVAAQVFAWAIVNQ